MKNTGPAGHECYHTLAQNLAQHLINLGPHPHKSWPGRDIRTACWLQFAFQEDGLHHRDFLWQMLAPRSFYLDNFANTETHIRKKIVAPLLRIFRGEMSIKEIVERFGLTNAASYHYWENGKRDVPLAFFLQFIDLQDAKLSAFLEYFNFPPGRRSYQRLFFTPPWTPSVYLLVQTAAFTAPMAANAMTRKMAQMLQLHPDQIQMSFSNLVSLRLLHFNGTTLEVVKGVHYAPAHLGPDILNPLHLYWMEKSPFFYQHFPHGLHKIEQAAMSRASMEKVRGWIEDLRAKIRQEIKNTEPETLVHFHWQMLDLLHPQENQH